MHRACSQYAESEKLCILNTYELIAARYLLAVAYVRSPEVHL